MDNRRWIYMTVRGTVYRMHANDPMMFRAPLHDDSIPVCPAHNVCGDWVDIGNMYPIID